MDPSQIPPNIPLVQPPPGQTSDFTNPVDDRLHAQILATLIICVILSTTSVILRVFTRCFIVKLFGWDDGLAVLALLLNFGLTVCFAGLLASGLDYSNYNTSLRNFLLDKFNDWTLWNALFTIFLYFTFAAIKVSVCMLYLRLLSKAHTALRAGVWALVALNIVILIGTTAGLFEFCHPALKLFRPDVPGVCNVSAVLFVVQGVLSVVTDLLILVPPVFVVWRSNAPKAQRVGFIATLCVGLVVTAIGFVRLGILVQELKTPDLSFNIQYLGTYLAIFEINFGLIAICMPAVRQLSLRTRAIYASFRHRSTAPGSNSWGKEAALAKPNRPTSKIPSFNTRYSEGPYTELGDRLQYNADKANPGPEIQRTTSEEEEYQRLGLRHDTGRIGNAV